MFSISSRILIVDDMTTMRKIVKKIVTEMEFFDIQDAADGKLAWDILSTANPPIDLIISDWNMPNCTGLELLKKVRADEKLKKTPFVMLTAEAEAHQIKEALLAGVTNYIIKPFTPETLKAKLEQTHKKVAAA
ncbi:MAG: response regulator [Bdellovibrionota bacterium]